MNEWDFSGLLNQLPDDMIVSAYTSQHQEHAAVSADDDMYPSAMPQAKAVYSDPLPEAHAPVEDLDEYTKQSTGSTLLPILMTAGCTAACIAGMILLIRPFVKADFPDDVTIQSNTQNIAITELTEAQPDETALSTSPVTQTGTETAGQTVTGTTATGMHAVDTTAPVSTDTAAQTAGTTQTELTSAVTTAAATGTRRGTASTTTGSRAHTTTARTSATRTRISGTVTTTRTETTRLTTGTDRITTTRRTTTTLRTTTTRRTTTATRRTTTTVTTTVTTTTTARVLPPLPEIVTQYCRTLIDGRPQWEDLRDISYHDGLDYTLPNGFDANGKMIRVPNKTKFPLTGLYVEIGCAQGAPGETVIVPVYVAGGDLASVIMFIDTPEGLELTDISTNLVEDFNLWTPESEGQRQDETNEDHRTHDLISLYLVNGSCGFVTTGNNLPMQDGYVLAYYNYTIPEDAQRGAVYPICLNPAKTTFDAIENTGTIIGKHYQYTLLNGVVVVE